MEIDWQQIFYAIGSFAMIVVIAIGLMMVWLMVLVYRLIEHIRETASRAHELVDDVNYFRKGAKMMALKFLLKIIDKGGQYER